ncbi:MAG: hypothetical protein HXX17_02475 [Geobacteraceae bacterium]|nr:hypothetical protein [Geobacteraceae bacterium]
MLLRLLVLSFTLFSLSGCGSKSSSTPATYSQVPAGTELTVYGVTDGSVMSRNNLYVTVKRPAVPLFRAYSGIQFTLDTQLQEYATAYFHGKETIQLQIPVNTAGAHQFVVKGILSGNQIEPGRKINFSVDYHLDSAGSGKYIGDRTVYDSAPAGSFNNMKVEFASYSATRSASIFAKAGINFTGLGGSSTGFASSPMSGVAAQNDVSDPFATIDLTMGPASNLLYLSGPAFNHFMELNASQGGSTGDLRLYRADPSSKVISAYCSSLTPQTAASGNMQAVFTLQSFDNVNFFGHMRLWKTNGGPVWTYQVAAYNEANGLSLAHNALSLWLSIPASTLDDFLLGSITYTSQYLMKNPSGALPSQLPGSLTVVQGSDGKFKINDLILKLDDMYRSIDPGNIQMKYSYKP